MDSATKHSFAGIEFTHCEIEHWTPNSVTFRVWTINPADELTEVTTPWGHTYFVQPERRSHLVTKQYWHTYSDLPEPMRVAFDSLDMDMTLS